MRGSSTVRAPKTGKPLKRCFSQGAVCKTGGIFPAGGLVLLLFCFFLGCHCEILRERFPPCEVDTVCRAPYSFKADPTGRGVRPTTPRYCGSIEAGVNEILSKNCKKLRRSKLSAVSHQHSALTIYRIILV